LETHLLGRVGKHVEFNVLKGSSLCHLPMDGADIGPGISQSHIDLEVPNTPQEIVLVDIPVLN
jgi:hypothetical protein